MNYRYGRRPSRDISKMADIDARPRCVNCGSPMAKAGKTPAGYPKWRCRKGGIVCWTMIQTPRKGTGRPLTGFFPGVERLSTMLQTMTYEDIGIACGGVSRKTVSGWVTRYELGGISPHGQHKRPQSIDCWMLMKEWLMEPLGVPFGGAGWHNVAGIEMAREGVMQ